VFSKCANPDCGLTFDYGQGRFSRFHKSVVAGQIANTVQHFWLCEKCCEKLTLDYKDGMGVLFKNRVDTVCPCEFSRLIAAA
jgi:hypothetical protein